MSPPLTGSKKDVLKCLSKIIIVIHPANTGIDIINKIDVANIDQVKYDIYLNKRLINDNNKIIDII